jgi:hypothetical protein
MKHVPNKYPKEKVEYIVTQYQKGISQKDIANELNTYNTTIRRILAREGIPVRGNDIVQAFVKKNHFQNIDNPETQYWLGWLATDGCLTNNSIVLEVSEKDCYILEYYKKYLNNEVSINKQYNKKFGTNLYRVAFKNKETYTLLKSIGITERKSLTLELKIPLSFSMLRGIIDGDGSVREGTIDVSIYSSSEKFTNQIYSFLLHNNFNPKKHVEIKNRKNPFYRLNLHKKLEVIRLQELLYRDNGPCLLRKKEKMIASISKQRCRNKYVSKSL